MPCSRARFSNLSLIQASMWAATSDASRLAAFNVSFAPIRYLPGYPTMLYPLRASRIGLAPCPPTAGFRLSVDFSFKGCPHLTRDRRGSRSFGDTVEEVLEIAA